MNTLTISWLQQQIAEMESARDEIPFGLGVDGDNTIAAFNLALASIEAEPYGYVHQAVYEYVGSCGLSSDHEAYRESETHIPLYRCAKLSKVVPEALPCPVLLEPGMRFGKGVRTQTMLDALQRRAEHHAELEAMTPEQRAEHEAGIAEFKSMLGTPAPIVMKDHQIRELVNELRDIAIEYHGTQQLRERIARTVRDAMLQGGTLIGEGTKQAGNSPVIPDGWVMVPVEPTPGMMVAGTLVSEFQADPAGMYRAMIAAAPDFREISNSSTKHFREKAETTTNGWIKCSDRMPGSQEWVIVFAKWANQQVLCWDDVASRWTDFEDQSYFHDMFTHWQPLPAAPQQEVDRG